MEVRRLTTNPIILPDMDERMGSNINGPSCIEVPDWVDDPLGRYYLYFSHHRGEYIRLAYSDQIEGPWQVYNHGALHLDETYFAEEPDSEYPAHIASPDIHIDQNNNLIYMYYHGVTDNSQQTQVALSGNGLSFQPLNINISPWYLKIFCYDGDYYGIARGVDTNGGGVIYKSADPLNTFKEGPHILDTMRHCAVNVVEDRLRIFYSNIGDCPESILVAECDLTGDWMDWTPSSPKTIVEPEMDYEGGNQDLTPSEPGPINRYARQVRDPEIAVIDDGKYLFYSIAGEKGIAIAEIV